MTEIRIADSLTKIGILIQLILIKTGILIQLITNLFRLFDWIN
jgi:hypothetical protein